MTDDQLRMSILLHHELHDSWLLYQQVYCPFHLQICKRYMVSIQLGQDHTKWNDIRSYSVVIFLQCLWSHPARCIYINFHGFAHIFSRYSEICQFCSFLRIYQYVSRFQSRWIIAIKCKYIKPSVILDAHWIFSDHIYSVGFPCWSTSFKSHWSIYLSTSSITDERAQLAPTNYTMYGFSVNK